jgi:hypothetical protein
MTEEFIAKVLSDVKDVLRVMPRISGYKLSRSHSYSGTARPRLYAALRELERRGEIVAESVTYQGGNECKSFVLPQSVKPDAPKYVGEKVLPLVTEFKPLKRDPFELWRLCERDPFNGQSVALIR